MEADVRVIRECASAASIREEVQPDCYKRYGVTVKQSVCECDISYCNGAELTKKSSGFILFVTALAIFLLKKFSA